MNAPAAPIAVTFRVGDLVWFQAYGRSRVGVILVSAGLIVRIGAMNGAQFVRSPYALQLAQPRETRGDRKRRQSLVKRVCDMPLGVFAVWWIAAIFGIGTIGLIARVAFRSFGG